MDQAQQKKFPNPLRPLIFLTHPPILILALVIGITFGGMYITLFVLPLALESFYHLGPFEIGLAYHNRVEFSGNFRIYLPYGIASMSGSILGGRAADKGYKIRGRGGRIMSTFFSAIFINIGNVGPILISRRVHWIWILFDDIDFWMFSIFHGDWIFLYFYETGSTDVLY